VPVSRFDQLYLADPEHVATSEYARHVAWWGQQLLTAQIDRPRFDQNRDSFADQLDTVAHFLKDAAEQVRRAEEARMEHFGDE
jgi:hypothetical protein